MLLLLNTFQRAREAAERILTKNPLIAEAPLIQGTRLAWEAATGDPDAAFLIDVLKTKMPTIARIAGEVRPTVLEEFRAGQALNPANKTAQEFINVIDGWMETIADILPAETPGGGPRPDATGTPGPAPMSAHGGTDDADAAAARLKARGYPVP